jgi:glycosyltransferase involved in cell wall biosynthesis
MKKKILLKAPVLTRSGYGEQSRFALRALRSRPDLFEIFIQPLQWGQTSWIMEEDEEKKWIDHTIEKTIAFLQHGGKLDATIQVTIPNEWERHSPTNIGFTAVELGIKLDYEFNFLVMAQFGPRKNLPNTVKWFVEEFHNDEVGLVVKTNIAKNCIMDREKLLHDMKRLMVQYPDRQCKVYLLHGDMTDKEIHSLFEHSQIKAFVTFTHGEGFGLPIYEAAYTGMPVVAPGWSGQLDFLVDKKTGISYFYNVEYDLQPVPENVIWEGVIIKESMWAYPREHSAKQQMRKCYADLTLGREKEAMKIAREHADRLHEIFSEEKQYALMVSEICETLNIGTDAKTSEVIEFD